MSADDVIVTYGEGNSVGKEMLRRYLRLQRCPACRLLSDKGLNPYCAACMAGDLKDAAL
jgi:hypothetical protein